MNQKIIIKLNGESIKENSSGHPFAYNLLPRVGDVIEYKYFDEPHCKVNNGKTIYLQVSSIFFSTEETYNDCYKNKIIIINTHDWSV